MLEKVLAVATFPSVNRHAGSPLCPALRAGLPAPEQAKKVLPRQRERQAIEEDRTWERVRPSSAIVSEAVFESTVHRLCVSQAYTGPYACRNRTELLRNALWKWSEHHQVVHLAAFLHTIPPINDREQVFAVRRKP